MKKRLKKIGKIISNNILGLIIGGIVFGCLGAYAATTIASSIVAYDNSTSGGSSTTVQGAVDELYSLAKSTEFKVGDYVSMTPTKTSFSIPMTLTGYSSDQTINPSELNLWRVIRINSDGTVDMVSEYVSSVSVYFTSQTGYQNLVGTLNYIAKQYENSQYTVGSRHMGYDGTQTEYITDTSALTSTTAPQTSSTSSSNVTSASEAKGLGDVGHVTDYNLVKTALGTLVAKNKSGTAVNYWLASRYYYCSSSSRWSYKGWYVGTVGAMGSNALYYYSSGLGTNSSGTAVRPIVTLKSEVKASSGDGSSTSPYVLP